MSAPSGPGQRDRGLAGAFCVAMKSDDPEVDGVERDHDGEEAGRRDQGGTPAAPGAKTVRVEVDRIDDPRDGGPGLLRIPPPPPAPRMLAPDGARHGAEGPDREAEQDGAEGQPVERLERRPPGGDRRAVQPRLRAR